MEINHEETNHKGIFFVKENGKQVAEMTYSLTDPDIMIIDHTWVDDSLRGQKVGNALVERGVEFARQQQYKIIPLCPFANKLMNRDQSAYADVLHK